MKLREVAGYTFIEFMVAVAIIALVVLLMMPSFGGYQTNASVRSAIQTALAQFRQAQTESASEDTPINILFQPSDTKGSDGNWQGWIFCAQSSSGCGSGAPVILKTAIPNSLNMTANCYRGAYSPSGNYTDSPCNTKTATMEVICVDAGGPFPYAMDIIVVFATGQLTMQQHNGGCP